MSTERLLREYVRAILTEDQGGTDASAGYTAHDIMSSAGAMNPYGMHYGSGNDLYKAFIKPFVDVAQTTAGKAKEMSVKTQTLVKVAFETVATTLIPILRNDYADIFKAEKSSLAKIRSEYGEVYKSNWDAIFQDDVQIAAFFYSPVAFLTVGFARKAPKAALELVSILSGGQLDGWVDQVRTKVKSVGTASKSHKNDNPFGNGTYKKGDKTHLPNGGPGYGRDYYEGVVREAPEQAANEGLESVVKLLSSDKLKAKLSKSSVVKKMENSGRAVVQHTLEQVFKQAQGVLTASSLQDLQNKTGSKLKGMEKLSQIPQQERQRAEQEIISAAKKSMKEFYVKNLEGQVKAAVAAGVPEDSAYVQDYQRIIGKIKAL